MLSYLFRCTLFQPFCKFVNPQAWELALSITPGCLPLLRGETTDAVFLLEVLSSNSYRLTSSYLLTRHQRAVPLTKIIVYYTPFSPSSVHPYESTTSTHRGTFVCRADVWGLRSSVHQWRNSHGAVTQPWPIPTDNRIHVQAYNSNMHCLVNNFKYIFTRIFKILMTMTRNLFLFHPLCFDIVVLLQCKNWRCDSKHKLPISKWHKKRWNVQLLKNGWTIRPSIKLVEGINHQC